ncbi:MAG: metallophosphoesterase family protein [Planctomycetaceae bacterium]|nr:metallophosphoesterase family protein [Planctomycetaceae bacterium]
MRLGLLADIHGQVDNLQIALKKLRDLEVDRFIVLGDVIYDSRSASETIALLQEHHAVGVWGNHDLGLCLEPNEWALSHFSKPVIEFFGTLESRYEVGDLLFSHTFPHQDPTDPTAYYLGPRPEDPWSFEESFSLFPHRVMFVGHFHRWLIAARDQHPEWDGVQPLQLVPTERYFVIVNAVMNGWAAIFDESVNILTPIRL